MATKRKAAKKTQRRETAAPSGAARPATRPSRGRDRHERATTGRRSGSQPCREAPSGGVRERQGLAGDAEGPARRGRARRGAACGAAGAPGGELQRLAFEAMPRRLHRDLARGRGGSGSGAAPARARHADAREGRLCAEEAARRLARSRQGAGAAGEGAAAPELRRARRSLRGGARDRAASRRTRPPSARRCGCSRRTPPPRRCSRSCCATRTSCARSGRSRHRRCTR